MIILTADCSRKYFASASLKRKFVLFLYIEVVLLKLMLMKKEALNDMVSSSLLLMMMTFFLSV